MLTGENVILIKNSPEHMLQHRHRFNAENIGALNLTERTVVRQAQEMVINIKLASC